MNKNRYALHVGSADNTVVGQFPRVNSDRSNVSSTFDMSKQTTKISSLSSKTIEHMLTNRLTAVSVDFFFEI